MCVVQCNDFLINLGVKAAVPEVLQDNTSTITLVTKGGGKYRNKYMMVRQCYVRERVQAGEVVVQYVQTHRMLADALTKPLQGSLFRMMTSWISGENQYVTGVR